MARSHRINCSIPCTFAVPATIALVTDGDTVAVRLTQTWALRLEGIDTPEMHVPEEREAAEVCAMAVAWWLAQTTRPTIYARDHDKYGGRVDGDIVGEAGGLAAWMLARGLARPYDGGAKHPWTDAELRVIVAQREQYEPRPAPETTA